MSELEKDISAEDASESTEIDDEYGPRPPVDPNNKLYTVISLLIFAVCYIGWNFIKGSLTMSYVLYDDALSQQSQGVILSEMGLADIPDGMSLEYARAEVNYGSDMLYVSFAADMDSFENEEMLAEQILPFPYGDSADERFAVYPYADMNAEYVYGSSYINNDDPSVNCIIYELDGQVHALFCSSEYSSDIRHAMKDAVKIPVTADR